ncbi:hypothetical protein F4825DRAFT_407031 [Nemania diffusa]|nr:hypothetical protein F4825DRAFT_407031 [Nemania diffusa]
MDHYIRGYGLISAIHVAGPSFYSEGWPPCYYIRVLLHEMVHAYLSLYMCHCLQCHCDMVNTSGVTGHGPSFLMMMDSIDDTLKTWDIGLEGVLRSSADGRGHGSFDEVRFHRNQELRKFRQLIGRTNNSRAYNAATMAGDSDGGVSMDANGKVKVTMKDMKPLGREPGMHIYMSAARIGTTIVSKSKLIETGNTVQALLKARTERRFSWPITYKKAKQSTDKIEVADEIEMIRERDFDKVEDLAAYEPGSDSDESEESEETPLFLIVLGLINRLTRRAWQRMRV